MPLILPRERWAGWLAGGGDPAEHLRPMSAAELEAIEVRPVGPGVGNVRNNGPHLLEPATLEPAVETTLF
jgi:putative SOS response-associated peptidase YedK